MRSKISLVCSISSENW